MTRSVTRYLNAAALVAGCTALLLLAGGCAATNSSIEVTGRLPAAGSSPVLDRTVAINDSSLAGELEISDMKSDLVGDLLTVQVSLRSKTDSSLPIQYRFTWFDGRGFEIAAGQAWLPLLVHGRETVNMQGVAPDRRAGEFRLKIRAQDSPEI